MIKTDTHTELQVIALLARGDTYQSISDSVGISVPTVSDIKKRNKQALATIQEKMISHQASKSAKILDKAHDLIDGKLTKAQSVDREREDLIKKLDQGQISAEEFKARWETLYSPTLIELNAIQKEAFNQSQIEQGKPTAISNTPKAKEELVELLEAIKKGDEVELFKMVFNPNKLEVIEGEIVG